MSSNKVVIGPKARTSYPELGPSDMPAWKIICPKLAQKNFKGVGEFHSGLFYEKPDKKTEKRDF